MGRRGARWTPDRRAGSPSTARSGHRGHRSPGTRPGAPEGGASPRSEVSATTGSARSAGPPRRAHGGSARSRRRAPPGLDRGSSGAAPRPRPLRRAGGGASQKRESWASSKLSCRAERDTRSVTPTAPDRRQRRHVTPSPVGWKVVKSQVPLPTWQAGAGTSTPPTHRWSRTACTVEDAPSRPFRRWNPARARSAVPASNAPNWSVSGVHPVTSPGWPLPHRPERRGPPLTRPVPPPIRCVNRVSVSRPFTT